MLSTMLLYTKTAATVFLICVFVILTSGPIDFIVNWLLFDKNQRTDNNVSCTSFRWNANKLEQMKCELNEKMCDFHKNIDKIKAAEMTVNEGLE